MAIVSVITTGVLSPFIAAAAAERRWSSNRQNQEIDLRRKKMEEAASLLTARWMAFNTLMRGWKAGIDCRSPEGLELVRAFNERRQDCASHIAFLNISFGPDSPVATACDHWARFGAELYPYVEAYAAGKTLDGDLEASFQGPLTEESRLRMTTYYQTCHETLSAT